MEAHEVENKRLVDRIAVLEAELKKKVLLRLFNVHSRSRIQNCVNIALSLILCISTLYILLHRTAKYGELEGELNKAKELSTKLETETKHYAEHHKTISEKLAKAESDIAELTKYKEISTKLEAEIKQQAEAQKNLAERLEKEEKSLTEAKKQLEIEQKAGNELKEKSEAMAIELKAAKESSDVQLQKHESGHKKELIEMTKQRDDALAELKKAEEMVVMQVSISLETPPEKEWEKKMMLISTELEQTKKKASQIAGLSEEKEKSANDKIAQLTRKLKENDEEMKANDKKNTVAFKEKALELETAQNKLKELKLDAMKTKSALDRKEIELGKLANIIKQLETQKVDVANAVNKCRVNRGIGEENGGEYGDID